MCDQCEANRRRAMAKNGAGAGDRVLTGEDLTQAIREMAQAPDALEVFGTVGQMVFGPRHRYGMWEALDRFLAVAHHSLPVRTYQVGTAQLQVAERDPTRIRVGIANLGSVIVFLGSDRRVTVGGAGDPDGGWPIFSNTAIWLDRVNTELWAVSTAAGQDVRVIELNA